MAYNNAPPPNTMGPATMMNPAMMGGGGVQPTGIDFMAALRKAKEIAEQLKENPNAVTNAANVPPPPQGGPPVQVHANGLQPTLGDFGLLQLVSTSTAPSGVCTEDYYIPNAQIGRVIGKGGESINRLQDVSSCRIQIATDNGTDKRIGTFTGQRENIDKARTMVHDIVAEYLIPQDQQPQDNLTEVPIPADRVGLVIGRSGETIKRLQEESGAKLQMIQDDPLADFKPLRMTGDLAAVEKAKQLVKDLLDTRDPAKMGSQYTSMLDSMLGNGQGNQQQQLEGGPSGGGDGNPGNALAIHGDNNNHNNNDVDTTAFRSIVSEVKVPRFAVGNVIGRGGETIKRLQAESGARVQFEQGDTGPADHRVCTVAGSKEMVAYAEKQIKEIVEECERRDNERRGGGGGGGMGGGMGGGGNKYGPPGGGGQGGPSKSVMVPTQVCGLIIGRGGESIKELQSRSGAHIALDRYAPPGAQEKAFHITGTEEQMNEAERLIKERMNEERDRRGGGGPGGGGGRGPPSGGGGRDFGGGGGGYNRGGPPGGGGPSYGGGYGGPPPGNFPNPGGFPNPYGGGFPNPYGGGPPGGGGYGGGHGGGGGGYGGGPPGMGGQNNYGPPGVQQQQQQQQQPQDSNTNNNNGPPGVQQQQDQSNSASGGGNDQSDAAAVAAGYPTAAEYQANTDWYNSQGYYGVVPM